MIAQEVQHDYLWIQFVLQGSEEYGWVWISCYQMDQILSKVQCRQWHETSKNELASLVRNRSQIMTFGKGYSWVSIEDSSELVKWSDNLEAHYPDLHTTLITKSFGTIRVLALGLNGHCLLGGSTWNWWNLSLSMREHVDIKGNCANIDLCALGRNGAYIVLLSSGKFF